MLPPRSSTGSSQLHAHQAGRDPELVHLTLTPLSPASDTDTMAALFGDAARTLRDQGLLVLQEKIYGEVAHADALRGLRETAWRQHGLAPETPVTFMGAPPAEGGNLAGLQFTCVDASAAVETVREGTRAVGRALISDELRLVYLSDMNGLDPANPGLDAPAQAARMFQRADALLGQYDLRYTQVARTWIYVARLLDWYETFNQVRTAFFRDVGVIDADGDGVLPASTGIQGHHPAGAECFMDVVAMGRDDQDGRPFSQIRSTHQCEASDYGSSFSRGMELPLGKSRLLYISGTASINLAGETVHLGDYPNQILETLTAAGVVLGHAGAALEDMVTGLGFHKTAESYAAWKDLAARGKIADLPMIHVLADVCRHDLLFELEPAAVL